MQFVEIDIEKVAGAEEEMRSANGGSGKVPTILVEGDGVHLVLVEPGDRELADAIRTCRLTGSRVPKSPKREPFW